MLSMMANALLIISIVFVVVMLLIYLPSRVLRGYVHDPEKPNDYLRLANETRTMIVQGAGGVFVVLGLLVGYNNLVALKDGQVTDR